MRNYIYLKEFMQYLIIIITLFALILGLVITLVTVVK